MKATDSYRCQGMTLIEVMVVVFIIGILAALAAPSFNDYIVRQRVKGVAEALSAAMQNARAEAVKSNQAVTVVIDNGTPWCFGATVPGAASCDCGGSDCAAGSVVSGTEFSGVSLTLASGEDKTVFDPLRGTASPVNNSPSITAGNYSMDVVISGLGSVRLCGNVAGYHSC